MSKSFNIDINSFSEINTDSIIWLQYPNNNASIDYMIFINELIKDKEREDIL